MTRHTAFIICSAVAAIAAGRVKFAFNFVHGYEVAAMLHVTVRTVAVSCRRLHFNLIGMAVIAEGAFVTGGAETVIRRGIEAVIFDEGLRMAESIVGLQTPHLLVFMTFGTVYLLTDSQCFRV